MTLTYLSFQLSHILHLLVCGELHYNEPFTDPWPWPEFVQMLFQLWNSSKSRLTSVSWPEIDLSESCVDSGRCPLCNANVHKMDVNIVSHSKIEANSNNKSYLCSRLSSPVASIMEPSSQSGILSLTHPTPYLTSARKVERVNHPSVQLMVFRRPELTDSAQQNRLRCKSVQDSAFYRYRKMWELNVRLFPVCLNRDFISTESQVWEFS